MITQRLILIDPPDGTIGLDLIAKVWACAGCRSVITGEGERVIEHPDDCPEMVRQQPVTEYGTLYSGGGYLTMNPAPEIEAIYPVADRIRDGMRNGGHDRRRIVVVEDWEEITEAPGVPS